MAYQHPFESSVNSEGIETYRNKTENKQMFESSVNSEGIETERYGLFRHPKFESSVNSEGIETKIDKKGNVTSLRAV